MKSTETRQEQENKTLCFWILCIEMYEGCFPALLSLLAHKESIQLNKKVSLKGDWRF